MTLNSKIETIAILVRLSDGTTREVLLTPKQKLVMMETLTEYLKPEKVSVSDPIEGVEISPLKIFLK